MCTFIPRFISLTGIFTIVTAAVVLPLSADAVARHPTHRSFSLVHEEGDNNSPVHIGLHFSSLDLDSTARHTTSASMDSSTGSLMTSFTFASPHPTPGSLSFAPEAQNMRLVPQPAGLPVRSSSSSMDLTTTKTRSTLHSMRGVLEFDVTSATPSPSSTPSDSSGIVVYIIICLLCILLICICVFFTTGRAKSRPRAPTVSSGIVLHNMTPAGSSSQAASSVLTEAADTGTPVNSPIAPETSSSSAGPKITPEAYVNSSPSSSSTARATTGH